MISMVWSKKCILPTKAAVMVVFEVLTNLCLSVVWWVTARRNISASLFSLSRSVVIARKIGWD